MLDTESYLFIRIDLETDFSITVLGKWFNLFKSWLFSLLEKLDQKTEVSYNLLWNLLYCPVNIKCFRNTEL